MRWWWRPLVLTGALGIVACARREASKVPVAAPPMALREDAWLTVAEETTIAGASAPGVSEVLQIACAAARQFMRGCL